MKQIIGKENSMIKFDFNTYTNRFIDKDKYNLLINQKKEYIDKLYKSDMTGWMKKIEKEIIEDIEKTAKYIKDNYDTLVVIGIGGSFLGSYSFLKLFEPYFNKNFLEIIYAGTTLSSKYLDELLTYLEDKNFCINVISKSGKTMETRITYKVLKDSLKRKYSDEEIKKRIIITTDKEKGLLREEAIKEGYKTFEIPNDIGGRYSFMTPAHLLPLACNFNLQEIIDGYYDGKRYIDAAYQYAVIRKLLFEKGKVVENFCVNEENQLMFLEWLKQLFGESEGKKGVGIFPTSCLYTRDLHSLGQFIQQGNKILFETFIKIKEKESYISYNNKTLNTINETVIDSVERAHFKGDIPIIEIEIDKLNKEEFSSLLYFFQLSAAFSGFLFDINPFDQPGVEVYKEEVRNSLGEI